MLLYLVSDIVSELNKLMFGFVESLVYLKNEVNVNLFNTAFKSSKLIRPSASISNFCIILFWIGLFILFKNALTCSTVKGLWITNEFAFLILPLILNT